MAKAETDEKVMAMVEDELKKNPGVSVDDLQRKAQGINKSVGSLTARQFHARYPLQIKRRKTNRKRTPKAAKTAAAKPARRASRKRSTKVAAPPPAPATGGDRDAIRAAFLTFALDLAGAEARKDVVKVLAGVDKYVDQVARAVAR
jgi:hypothetical protein